MEITEILSLITQIVGVAAMIATMTPNKTDDKYIQYVLNIINLLGANVGKARNG